MAPHFQVSVLCPRTNKHRGEEKLMEVEVGEGVQEKMLRESHST